MFKVSDKNSGLRVYTELAKKNTRTTLTDATLVVSFN